MSKKSNSSKNCFYQERIKSCFNKKSNRLVDSALYEQPYQKLSKSKTHHRKTNLSQKKEIKEKLVIQVGQQIKINDNTQNKQLLLEGDINITIDDKANHIEKAKGQIKSQCFQSEQRLSYQDDLIKNCNLAPLKTLICQKLNDCDFFSGQQNIKNSSKRLLFMEYQDKELYINNSRQKSKTKEKIIPKEILHAFKNVKSPKNYFSINSRIPTQQTYDTSDPSNCSKMTPSSLTPRSIGQQQMLPNRRSSFTINNVPQLNISQIQKQYQSTNLPNLYYPSNYYYYGGYCEQNIFPSEIQTNKVEKSQYKNFNIDVFNIQFDGRTTLMIKNIPNKYSREMLIQLFDKTHRKKYDFFYLPIDSDNSCNIGYAFINFMNCIDIKDFYQLFNGQKWQKFNSEKICKLTYARMQGTSSLVQHIEITTPKSKKLKNCEQMNFSNLSMILEKQRQEKFE